MIIHRRREPTPEATAGLRRGDTIAGYRIERVLGTGGMGAVYQATQLSLERRVALKVIAPGVSMNAALRDRFRREGHLQAVIEHPHILPV
jgi:serine/threonine protein kinase